MFDFYKSEVCEQKRTGFRSFGYESSKYGMIINNKQKIKIQT